MHTSSTLVLVLAVFGACLVEMVEALTLVVAAGVSRGWRSALEGAAAAFETRGLPFESLLTIRDLGVEPVAG